ncbi:MAG: hypothetical protein ABF320_07795 [Lentimonas sp.]
MKHKLIATCITSLAFGLSASAATFTWQDGGDGDWSTNANWTGGTAPTSPSGGTDNFVFGDAGYTSTESLIDLDYAVDTITFNSETSQNFRLATTTGSHTLGADSFIVDAGVTGTVTLAARVDTSGNTDVINNSATTVTVNLNTSGSGDLSLNNGAFKINGSAPYNSVHTGGYTIENASLEINGPVNSGTQEGPFGTGNVLLGASSTSDAASLSITNIRSKVTTLTNDFIVNAPGATLTHNSPQTTFIDGNVTLNEDLSIDNNTILRFRGDITGTGAISAGNSNPALSILVFEGTGNSFVGDFSLIDSAFQGRENNIMGDTANVVNLDEAFFRLYVDNTYLTNNPSSTITLDNDFVVTSSNGDTSSIGTQGEGGGAFPVSTFTGVFTGNISIDADITLELDASSNENFAQTSTSDFTGDITDGANTAGLLILGGGNAGSNTTVNFDGTVTTDGPTSIQIDPDNDDGLLYGNGYVNLNGSLSNANITVGAQNTLQGLGTINLNIDGSNYDSITVEGTLDISGLTLDFNETGAGATLGIYILADYSEGTLSGANFGTVIDLPSGYTIDYNYEGLGQIALVQSSGLFVWDGDTNTLASTGNNWVSDVAPATPGTGTEDFVIGEAGYGQTSVNFNVNYTIDSLIFNGNVDSAFSTAMGAGTHKVTVNNIVRDTGADGDITVNGRYNIPASGTTLSNKHASSPLTFNGHNTGTGGITYQDGNFAIKTASANNSTFAGGTVIENATLEIDNNNNAGGLQHPFGNGPISLGESGSNNPANLTITLLRNGVATSLPKTININAPATYDIDQAGTFTHTGQIVLANDLTLDSGGVHSITGKITGSGNITTQTGTTIFSNNSNDFVGDLTATNVLQLRANNAAGSAANQIIVDGGQFRTFMTADAATLTLANPITVSSGNFGSQAQGNVDTGIFNFNGAITLNSNSTLPFIAESNGANEQALIYNINGAIADGDNTASLQIEGGGFATSSSVVNITGGLDIGGSLLLVNETNLGTLTTNLNSTTSNANVTIGADTTLAGSGTLTYNIDDSTADLIDNDGSLDITGLTLAITEGVTGANSPVYIIADYGDGTLTGAAFSSVTGTPAGYSVDYAYESGTQIALVDGSITGLIYWDGGGANSNWSTAGNWVANTAPTQPGTGTEDIYFATAGNPYGTTVFESDYVLNSITITEHVDSAFSINSGAGSHTLTVDTITVDTGADGPITLSGRYTIPAGGTELINNSTGTVFANLHTQADVGTGPVTYSGGAFEISTGAANNAAHDGGIVIENATVEVNTIDAGASTYPFGTGTLLLGEASTLNSSILLLTSVREGAKTNTNGITVNSPSATISNQTGAAQTFSGALTLNGNLALAQNANTFFSGAISGTGDLSVSGGAIFVIDGGSANTFTGSVSLNSTTQVRKDNGLGNTANSVTNNASLRLFQVADASTLTLDNAITFTGGSYGFQAQGATAATGTANQNGALTLDLAGSFLITAASNASNVQDLTLNLTAAIDDSINSVNVEFQGGGIADGDSIINLGGTNLYDGTTTLSRLNDLGTLTVNVNGSQENSNITVGANTTLAGSGTLNWNIGGASANFINVNGTLDISGLTIDFNETSALTESVYVLADYSAGSLTGASFASETDLPSGYAIDYAYSGGTQIALVQATSGDDDTSLEEFVENFTINGSGNPDFSWQGFTGSVYIVERTIDLSAMPIVWTPVYNSGTLGSEQVLAYEDTTSFDAAFYRLVINP